MNDNNGNGEVFRLPAEQFPLLNAIKNNGVNWIIERQTEHLKRMLRRPHGGSFPANDSLLTPELDKERQRISALIQELHAGQDAFERTLEDPIREYMAAVAGDRDA
ncbi:hypothetical protein J8273_3428 [Carpediemonas membranifera]|uniref:Uncharacterized protein n=1 Tax=Carpediemonas membranifera TaxID=201153 RepID=A0A8J6E9G1_9EUKA|nr:hypothetical protein J8273_3428 [Carpediemonas membranifera]|eukprot:KAG9393295.1 hypothetical protein J8273_3428 [Carpediemonas membranifera]